MQVGVSAISLPIVIRVAINFTSHVVPSYVVGSQLSNIASTTLLATDKDLIVGLNNFNFIDILIVTNFPTATIHLIPRGGSL